MFSNRASSLIWIRKVAFVILILAFLFSIYRLIAVPGNRTGYFGIGLPSRMINYDGKQSSFSISYPESWVVSETPNGNHRDQDIIATILVPGRSWPKIVIEKVVLPQGGLEELAKYEENKINKEKTISHMTMDRFKTSHLDGLIRDYSWQTSSWLLGSTFIRCEDFYAIQNNYGYTISFCAEEGQWAEVENSFNEIIESFYVKATP